jgi:hypothetical protein
MNGLNELNNARILSNLDEVKEVGKWMNLGKLDIKTIHENWAIIQHKKMCQIGEMGQWMD